MRGRRRFFAAGCAPRDGTAANGLQPVSCVSSRIDSAASVAGRSWRKLPVVYQVDPVNSDSKRTCDGLIGQHLLNDFIITYDLPAGVVYLEPWK